MSESFKDILNLFNDSYFSDFSKFSSRGIEKESLRVLDKWTTATMKDLEKKVHDLEKRIDDLEEELFD